MFSKVCSVIFISSLLYLSGCSGKLFTVYKIDVQQGNAVEPEKVDKLEVGMTKEQVEFLLGTPMIRDIFHPDRWDYIYFLIPGYGERERRHLTLFFEADNVSEIIKDQIELPPPDEQEDQEANEAQENSTEESSSVDP